MTTRADISSDAASAVESALTQEQVLIIQMRARTLPLRWRQKFFNAVADQLALVRSPTNSDISAICSAARRSITVGISVPSMER